MNYFSFQQIALSTESFLTGAVCFRFYMNFAYHHFFAVMYRGEVPRTSSESLEVIIALSVDMLLKLKKQQQMNHSDCK